MDLIYLCGGIGKRAKLGYPKQFVLLGGKPIFLHGLEKFCNMKEVKNIIIPSSDIAKTISYMLSYGNFKSINKTDYFNGKKVVLIENGNSRQASVRKALEYVNSEFVLIGEGVRPFISYNLINNVINKREKFVTPVANLKATPIIKPNGFCNDRDKVFEVQLPQKFNVVELINAYNKIDALGDDNYGDFTDDCQLVNYMTGAGITIIDGIEENIKITTPLDIEIAKAIYKYLNGGMNE